MKAYYNILNELKTLLDADELISIVTEGGLDEVDIRKKSMWANAHILINNATLLTGSTVQFNISVFVMDQVDVSKDAVSNVFWGNDNEQDVLNSMLAVCTRLVEQLKRGDIVDDGYQLSGDPTAIPFTDRFQNKIAGWELTMNVDVTHDMTIC